MIVPDESGVNAAGRKREAVIDALFQPLVLGKVVLPNRIVMSPMTRSFSPGGIPGENVAAYYERRAIGGAGLIVTEGVAIDHPAAVDDPAIPVMQGAALAGWRRVTTAVHDAGGLIVPQLWHQGALRNPALAIRPDIVGLRPSGLWGTPGFTSYPSNYVEAMQQPILPMTEEDIEDVIAAFARSAGAAKEAGFDGIAVHGGHGYLIDTFFWADTNRRNDRYGGDVLRRAEFGAAVVRAIREAVGDNLPIFFRFSQHKQQDYNASFADSPEELSLILGTLADAGVDVFDASSRRFDRPAFKGSSRSLAGWARALTGKPTMAVGGIGISNWLKDATSAVAVDNLDAVAACIQREEFDLAAVGRAILNDAEWPRRVREGSPLLPFDPANIDHLI